VQEPKLSAPESLNPS